MKKIITSIVLLLMLIACNKSNDVHEDFDVNIGKELCDKIVNGDSFSQDDYSKAIEILQYDIDIQSAALNRDADPDSATLEYLSFSASQEYAQVAEITEKLGAYIYSHLDELEESNRSALSEVEQSAVEFAKDLKQILNAQ